MCKSDIAFFPIGDRFTTGPGTAAKACEFLGIRKTVPHALGHISLADGST